MATILVLVPDLFFSTKIEDAARRLGYPVESVDKNADFAEVIAEKKPALVLLTFERTGDAWERLAVAAHAAGVKTIAFGSHTNIEAFKQAKALGCDEVMANSRLSAVLGNLLPLWMGA